MSDSASETNAARPPYCLVAALGEGTHGTVYAATDTRTGADVAVKLDMRSISQIAVQEKIRSRFSGTLPRVDTGSRVKRRAATAGTSKKSLAYTQ